MRTWPLVIALLVGCGDDPIQIHHGDGTADYNRAELMAAIDGFVTAGRTVEAYGKLAAEVKVLRPGMDATVAELAELQLVVLAAGPVEALRARPPAEQVERLALTVWAVALAPAIHVLAPDGWRDPREALVAPRDQETPHAYVQRLCGTTLAFDCQHVVPDWQGPVVHAEAISHMVARVRIAVENCEECVDPAWRNAVSRWEALEREALVTRRIAEATGAPTRWPVAGAGAEPWPVVEPPLLELETDGDWVVDGATIEPARRAAVLRELHARGDEVLGLHALPGGRIDALDQVIAAAASAGFARVAIEARVDAYPWPRHAYLIRAVKAPKRRAPGDTVQVFLRSRDDDAPAPASDGEGVRARRP